MTGPIKKLSAFFLFLFLTMIVITFFYSVAGNRIVRLSEPDAEVRSGLDGIRDGGELVVLTVSSPTTFRLRGEEISGYEVDLTQAVARDLGVEVTYKLFDDIPSLIQALENGEGHIAAPGLTQRDLSEEVEGQGSLIYGPAYKTVTPELICRREGAQPASLAEAEGLNIGVIAGSGNEQTLEQLAHTGSEIDYQPVAVSSGLTLAGDVHDRQLDCAIINSNTAAIARRLFPEIVTTTEIDGEDRQLAWGIAPQSMDLESYLIEFFDQIHQNGFLRDLDERYYGYLEEFDYVDISVFRRRIEERLPRYEKDFRKAAEEHGLDWTMLAAQGYQESHWDPRAKSPTGVRGLMMLTLPTAKEVGVSDRLDPIESIRGGALYLDRLYDRLPDSITGYDRLWMAIAAYNVGYGHLLDARQLARREGLDPDKWRVVKEMLPRLTQKRYYTTVKHGYARGYEPVKYVSRIREYDEVLTSRVPNPEVPPFRPSEVVEASASDQAGGPTAGSN